VNAFHCDCLHWGAKKARWKVTENFREPEIILQRRALDQRIFF